MIRPTRLAPLLVLAVSLTAATVAMAGEVYQWKDANGITHYSQTPPKDGKYQTRSIYHRTPSTDGQPAQTAQGDSPQCTTARKNIELLQSGARLQVDSNGDGKADRDLSDNERAEQLRMAQTVARVNCTSAAPPPQAASTTQN